MPLPPPVQRVQPLPVVLADLVAADLQGRGHHAVLGGERLARHHEAADLLDLREVAVDPVDRPADGLAERLRSEEHTSELQSLMRNSYAVLCLKTKNNKVNKD